MKITTISYHRKKNLGNYETEDIELTALLEEFDDIASAIRQLKHEAREALDIQHPISPSAKPEPENFDDQPW